MGDVAPPYRLRVGDTGPVEQSSVGAGAACLTVARMLVDPVFASWVRSGEPHPPGTPPGETESERFTAYARVVITRTNRLAVHGHRPTLPWPRRLGTSPWGARDELEGGAARPGARYDVDLLRSDDVATLREAYERLAQVVVDGEPALLYVGDGSLPRHVTLVLPGEGDGALTVYDPGDGAVTHLRRDSLVGRSLGLSGWDIPWLCVQPEGLRPVRAKGVTAWVRAAAGMPRASASA